MRKMSTVKLEFYNGSGEWNKGALYTMHVNYPPLNLTV